MATGMSVATRSELALHVHGSIALFLACGPISACVSAALACSACLLRLHEFSRADDCFNSRLPQLGSRVWGSAAHDCRSSAECLLSY